MKNFTWGPEHVTRMLALSNKGISHSQIAKMLNAEFGGPDILPVTRNAVIGKINRLRVSDGPPLSEASKKLLAENPPARGTPVTKQVRVRQRMVQPHTPKDDLMHEMFDKAPEPAPDARSRIIARGFNRPKTIFTRVIGKECCFPHPDDQPSDLMRVCGDSVVHRGASYCDYHSKMLLQPKRN